jgi:Holliday junction DNA helicase RuvA
MRDRLKGFGEAGGGMPLNGQAGTAPAAPQTEAFNALLALGYKPAEVTRMLKGLDPSLQTTEALIRGALQMAASK